ncbi:MAG: 4'-phosphopantetheinyl transferase superfamily protein [Chitinophagia bacterium]|jgi:phosphopantetheinyl transferase|nr:4'-phosphopantetheinyl transferase superfamily protein [Chitinophagia bacterium]
MKIVSIVAFFQQFYNMPLILKETSDKASFACWETTEDLLFFEDKLPYRSTAANPQRKIQQMSARMALFQLDPAFPFSSVQMETNRKPALKDRSLEFSLTHTRKMAAAILSSSHKVGIDVEKIDPRVLKIESKFLHPYEREGLPADQQERVSELTLMWTIKETVFKCFGKSAVDFSHDILIKSILHEHALAKIDFMPLDIENATVCFKRVADHWLSHMSWEK